MPFANQLKWFALDHNFTRQISSLRYFLDNSHHIDSILALQQNKFTLQQRLKMFKSLYQRFVDLPYAEAALIELAVKQSLIIVGFHISLKSARNIKVEEAIFLLHLI